MSLPAATPDHTASSKQVMWTVVVCALGYFVDIYDLILFAVVRKPSLLGIGVAEADLESVGGRLISLQMGGMLLGGILWGVLGDKIGRKSVLFGSILTYSLANIANAYVTSVESYAALRLIAGIGLAGELGAAVTLVSEVMSSEKRGYGTTAIAGVGVFGAVAAALVSQLVSWQTAYLIGGALGLGLLALRVSTFDSKLFDAVKASSHRRGDLRMLLAPPARLGRYLACIAIGVPIWFSIGILVAFAPEIAKSQGVTGAITGGQAVLYAYAGLGIGDIAAGLLSQWFGSRRKAVALFLALDALALTAYVLATDVSPQVFLLLVFAVGVANGYWAVFATTAAEQFGTNLRATVATTAPNFVRGSLVAIELAWSGLKGDLGRAPAAAVVGAVCLVIAAFALSRLQESFGKGLDWVEE
jgi:putative MFS transporter